MADEQAIVKGSCLCQRVKYEFRGQPATTILCHCSVCKRLTSSLFALHYPIAQSNFSITSGQPKTHNFTHPAGMDIEAAFCDQCGTLLYKRVEAEPFRRSYLVQAGTTELKPGLEAKGLWVEAPKTELWVSQRAPWLAPVEGAEQKPEF
ncbi:hypothetical protein OQA88_638 [Cercophora sp. LCS_1]